MRNRKSLQSLHGKPSTVVKEVEPKKLTEIETKLAALSGAIASMENKGQDTDVLQEMLEAVREAARRPEQIGCRVFYDSEGRCSGMVCTTNPAEIAQIEKPNRKVN